jgi:hypothetical protein
MVATKPMGFREGAEGLAALAHAIKLKSAFSIFPRQRR